MKDQRKDLLYKPGGREQPMLWATPQKDPISSLRHSLKILEEEQQTLLP